MASEHLDVVIIGAGISGIGAAVHLKQECPSKSFAILEGRADIGGTWSLFKYPGIRSDSDMYTLGFRFKPWTSRKAIADGPAIMSYLRETVDQFGLASSIRHEHRVTHASWDSESAQWTLHGTRGPDKDPLTITCNVLLSCTGYYDYDKGYTPDFRGMSSFKGQIVHPQHWPDDLDYRGKTVVVIGSGATAVTLIPAMIDNGAGHVTMLQRTPTYMVSRPSEDKFATRLQDWLPAKSAYAITRWRNVLQQQFMFSMMRKKPEKAKESLIKMVADELGPDYDIATHFTPPYNPWDQRLCLVPDSDIFRVIRDGQANIVTDHIDTFTENGIKLKSGKELPADIIVTATGLNMQMLSGMALTIDGVPTHVSQHVLYKGIMFSNIPNLLMWFGYTNASWTLKADLTSEYACRLINHMDQTGTRIVTPALAEHPAELEDFVTDFSSGYFARVMDQLPKQGKAHPWKLFQNYRKDVKLLRKGTLDDGTLMFAKPHKVAANAELEPMLEAAE
ncbi:MAG: flavin-containing monooxygenase [Sphingomonadaceae bacterium]